MMKKSGLAVMVTLTLVFSLALAVTSAQAKTYLDSVMVAGTEIKDGEYYKADTNGGLTEIDASSVDLTTGYVTYDSSTGTLTLNHITINAKGTNGVAGFGIYIGNSTPYALTIKLAGASKIVADQSGVDAYKGNITITSDMQRNSLRIDAEDRGVRVNSLTVDSNARLSVGAKYSAILAENNIVLKGNVTASSTDEYGIWASNGDIMVEGTAVVDAIGKNHALMCAQGKFTLQSGGQVTARLTGDDGLAVCAKEIAITGGKITIGNSVMSGAGLVATQDLTISGNPEINIETKDKCLQAGGHITIKGGKLTLASNGNDAIYAADTIKISGGSIAATASGTYSLYGKKGVEISGGTVSANGGSFGIFARNGDVTISNGSVSAFAMGDGAECAVRSSSGNISITGGKLTAATKSTDWPSLSAAQKIIINGDTVVYVNDSLVPADDKIEITKGIVYQNAVKWSGMADTLKGGTGTVYGDPNVTDLYPPTDSTLGTPFDSYVTIALTPSEVTYDGEAHKPEVTVTANKTVLSKTLVLGTDYRINPEITPLQNVGSQVYNITANAPYSGTKTLTFTINPKALTWDTSDLTVSKKVEDGTTTPAAVSGTLTVNGILDGDDVQVSYDSLTVSPFPASQAGAYALEVTVNGLKLSGADAGNYTLPSTFTLNAKIEPKPQTTLPKTGDNSQVALWAALMALSAAAFAVTLTAKKRSVK